jgi:D-cysteine desulfhydrase family pyridoxal phosphate-dependent enzyme
MRLATFPRFPLTTIPTPLQRARNLEAAIGVPSPRIYIKRDDMTGLAFGGNKARKLEYLVADALAAGATTLVTEGGVQSNHARQTAAAAVLAGLKSVLVLDAREGTAIRGNLLLDHLMGADIRIVTTPQERPAMMARIVDDLMAVGDRPYLIPSGGSVPIGALGYVAMVQELMGQLQGLGEAPTRLYFATGSMGTQTGLVVGARAFNAPFAIQGIADEEIGAEWKTAALSLIAATADLIGLRATFSAADLLIDDGFVGEGYAKRTADGLEAIRLLARTEAIFLEPVYTGKAMAGLLAHIRSGRFSPDESVIFVHTGGSPALFVHGADLLA